MPTDRTNKIFYVELQSSDLDRSKAFFREAFGWTFKDYGPDYASFHEDDPNLSGGIYRSARQSTIAGGGILLVLHHQNLDEAAGKVTAAGGKITKPAFPFPGGRRFHFQEPGGNELAVCAVD